MGPLCENKNKDFTQHTLSLKTSISYPHTKPHVNLSRATPRVSVPDTLRSSPLNTPGGPALALAAANGGKEDGSRSLRLTLAHRVHNEDPAAGGEPKTRLATFKDPKDPPACVPFSRVLIPSLASQRKHTHALPLHLAVHTAFEELPC